MKILLVGSEGFIGKHVFWRLRSLGFEVVCWDKKIGRSIINQEVPVVDIIIHLAANLFDHFNDNYLSTRYILNQSDRFKKIIFTSSAAVYGDKINAKEEDVQVPFGEYGETKWREENAIIESGKDYSILRLGNVYGCGTDHGVFNYFIHGGKNINGDGEQVRDFVHVDDVVVVILRAVLSSRWNGVFNIGTQVGTSINKLFSIINPNEDPIYLGAKNEIRYSSLNIDKARKNGYEPRYLRS